MMSRLLNMPADFPRITGVPRDVLFSALSIAELTVQEEEIPAHVTSDPEEAMAAPPTVTGVAATLCRASW